MLGYVFISDLFLVDVFVIGDKCMSLAWCVRLLVVCCRCSPCCSHCSVTCDFVCVSLYGNPRDRKCHVFTHLGNILLNLFCAAVQALVALLRRRLKSQPPDFKAQVTLAARKGSSNTSSLAWCPHHQSSRRFNCEGMTDSGLCFLLFVFWHCFGDLVVIDGRGSTRSM